MPAVERLIDLAIDEDLGRGDITSAVTLTRDSAVTADLVSREPIIVFGVEIAAAVFARIEPDV